MPDRDTRGLTHRQRARLLYRSSARSALAQRADERQRQQDPVLSEAARLRRGWRWRQLAGRYLRAHPLCERCARGGWTVAATTVDHVEGLAIAPGRAFDLTNLQALCGRCHGRKSAQERRARRRTP